VGLLQKMPLMKELVESLGLYSCIVNYCAFGRDDKKPTYLWTNDFALCSTLSEFKCGGDGQTRQRCPYAGGIHPIGARRDGRQYNAAAIPQPLAEEVAEHVHANFYQQRIRYTKPVKLADEQVREFDQAMESF